MEIEVWLGGMLDCVSKITAFNDDLVVVDDGKYLRSNCVLKMKGIHLQLVK
jgi:hypothetical protein